MVSSRLAVESARRAKVYKERILVPPDGFAMSVIIYDDGRCDDNLFLPMGMELGRRAEVSLSPVAWRSGLLKVWLTSRLDRFQEG